MDFRNKKVLVTGGAIRIGREICKGFARAGATVVIHCNTHIEEGKLLLEELGGPGKGHALFSMDLSNAAELEKEENIRPFILDASEQYFGSPYENHAQIYENGRTYFFRLTTGSVNNLKPELVMEAFCNFLGVEASAFAFQYHRIELYKQAKDTFVPLYQ